MDYIYSYDEFVAEARVVYKRKYTEKHPERSVSSFAHVRERVMSFVKENSPVSREQLMEFIHSMNEETGGTTSRKWLTKNARLFSVQEKGGSKFYSLSKEGHRIHKATINQKIV